jgi:hypothetical protein
MMDLPPENDPTRLRDKIHFNREKPEFLLQKRQNDGRRKYY